MPGSFASEEDNQSREADFLEAESSLSSPSSSAPSARKKNKMLLLLMGRPPARLMPNTDDEQTDFVPSRTLSTRRCVGNSENSDVTANIPSPPQHQDTRQAHAESVEDDETCAEQAMEDVSSSTTSANNQVSKVFNSREALVLLAHTTDAVPAPLFTEDMSIDKNIHLKKGKRKRSPQKIPGQTSGRWTAEEHQAFLKGLQACGREWKKVAQCIPTRTSAQIRSHAQKYFAKLQRDHESAVMAPEGGTRRYCPDSAVSTTSSCSEQQSITPSVQHRVDRIVANPPAAQQEVERTLGALRDRYRQLQARLEDQQNRRRDGIGSLSPRKRGFEDLGQNMPSDNQVDSCSVASSVSASVASLGNDELVALHVLGASFRADGNGGATPLEASRRTSSEANPSQDVPPTPPSAEASVASNEDTSPPDTRDTN